MEITRGMNGRPWWRFDRGRVPRNPLDPIQVIEHLEYCRICDMDVDIQVQAALADDIYVYRKRCGRCGGVIQWGIRREDLKGGS